MDQLVTPGIRNGQIEGSLGPTEISRAAIRLFHRIKDLLAHSVQDFVFVPGFAAKDGFHPLNFLLHY